VKFLATIQKIKGTGVPILIVEQNAKQALGVSDRGYVGRGQGTPAYGAGLAADPKSRACFGRGHRYVDAFGFEFVNST
jgi:branched-chain amino acid transport system ATP-binding protein